MATKEEILIKHETVEYDKEKFPKGYPYIYEAMEEYKNQECEAKDTSYQRLTDQFELLAGKVIKKDKEIERLKGLLRNEWEKRFSHLEYSEQTLNNLFDNFKSVNNL